jgi:hypothetical protein
VDGGDRIIMTMIFAILFPLTVSDYKVTMTTAFDSKVRFLHLQSSLKLSGTTNTTVPYQTYVRVLTDVASGWLAFNAFPARDPPNNHSECFTSLNSHEKLLSFSAWPVCGGPEEAYRHNSMRFSRNHQNRIMLPLICSNPVTDLVNDGPVMRQ